MAFGDVLTSAESTEFSYGFGPMNDVELEEALFEVISAGGGDWLGDWDGSTIIGWVEHNFTGETTLSITGYGFVYGVIDGSLIKDENAGDAAVGAAPNGYYYASPTWRAGAVSASE
jgi:hypothetical protein